MNTITSISGNNEYEIHLIENETDARLCAQLIAQEFASSNSFSVFNRSTSEEIYDTWIWPLMKDVFEQKLSFLVRHHPTNEIVASIIAGDLFLSYNKHPYDPFSPASDRPSPDLFDEMCGQFVEHDLGEKLEANLVLFIGAGATHSQHSGKGIAGPLRTHLCNYARDTKGFKYAFIHVAHPATRHIYTKKMNGKEMTTIDPATWLWKKKGDGQSRPFEGYKGEPIINVLVPLK